MAFGDYQNEIYLQGLAGIVPKLPMIFAELEAKAEQALPPSIWSYVAGGAGDERTQRANAEVFGQWGLMPRMFVGAAQRDLYVDLFGLTLPSPLFMAPIMFPLHVIGELVRPVSLSVRLFGNLTGEDLTLALLVMLTPFVFKFIPVPIHLVMVLMALLFSTIQAVIFTLLSTVYLSLAIEEHEEGH